jgi:hypothetical protein
MTIKHLLASYWQAWLRPAASTASKFRNAGTRASVKGQWVCSNFWTLLHGLWEQLTLFHLHDGTQSCKIDWFIWHHFSYISKMSVSMEVIGHARKRRLNTIKGLATLKQSKKRNPSVFSVNSNTQQIILKYLIYKTLRSQRFEVIYLSTILCSDVQGVCKLGIIPCTSLCNVLFQLYHCTVSALNLQY